MKITFFLFIISVAIAANTFGRNATENAIENASENAIENASENAIENATEISNETPITNATFIECQYCPNRWSPAINKWLQEQISANQAAGFSKVFYGFLFIVFL